MALKIITKFSRNYCLFYNHKHDISYIFHEFSKKLTPKKPGPDHKFLTVLIKRHRNPYS